MGSNLTEPIFLHAKELVWCIVEAGGTRMSWRRILVIVFVFCNANEANAIEHRDVSGEHQWSSPALQGAAGIGALSESWVDQAQTDPSLLARRQGNFEIEFAGLTGVVSRDVANNLVSTMQSLTQDSNDTKGTSSAQATVNALSKVRSLFGQSMTFQAHGSVLAPRIGRVGVAPYFSGVLDASIDNAAWPKLDSFGGGYGGVLVSYSQIIGKDFDLGVALRPGVGGYRNYEIDLSVLGDFLGENASTAQAGSSLSELTVFPTAVYCPLDLAVGWWPNKATRVALISKNTFDASPLSSLSGSPGRLQNRLNVNVVRDISLPSGKNHSLKIASELQDLAGLKNGWNEVLIRWQWAGQYAFRLPFRSQTSFGLNVGMHSGYPVAGVHLDLFFAKLEAALSARENGAYPGQRPNRLQSIRLLSQIRF
jgi:hypothetical protein